MKLQNFMNQMANSLVCFLFLLFAPENTANHVVLVLFFPFIMNCWVFCLFGAQVKGSGTGKSFLHLLQKPESYGAQFQVSALTQPTNYPYIKIRPFIKRRKSESNTASTISSHYPIVKWACLLDIFPPPGSRDLSRTFQTVKTLQC